MFRVFLHQKILITCILNGEIMIRLFVVAVLLVCLNNVAYCDDTKEVEKFFNNYVAAANSYDSNYFDYYSDDAKIIRVVEKNNGSKEAVNVPLERYKCEAKRSTKLMKLRQYKNYYFNVKIFPHGKDYKIVALRMPSTSNYKIPAHFIVGKNSNGEWKIKEESMNTKVQTFLKHS